MKKLENLILLKKRNKLIIPEGTATERNPVLVGTFLMNFNNIGFIMNSDVIDRLFGMTQEELVEVNTFLTELMYDTVYINPMALRANRQFPHSTLERDDAVRFIEQVLHYMTNEVVELDEVGNRRDPFQGWKNKTVLSLGTMDDFKEVISNLISANTAISVDDRATLTKVFKKRNQLFTDILEGKTEDEIPNKENLAFIANLILSEKGDPNPLRKFIKTSTDVLRIITAYSGGDITLKEPTRYKSMPRKTRRFFMQVLSNVANQEDLCRYPEQWKRVAEKLHPQEYPGFEELKNLFKFIHEGEKLETFNSQVDKQIADSNLDGVLRLYRTRPGEFIRALSRLVKVFGFSPKIVETVTEVGPEATLNVLMTAKRFFLDRTNAQKSRMFIPKGNISKPYIKEEFIPAYNFQDIYVLINSLDIAINKKLSKLSPLGKVYISPEMNNIVIPNQVRNLREGLKTLTRFSKFDLPEDIDFIRLFIYWKNGINERGESVRTDLDLSATVLNSALVPVSRVYYGTPISKNRTVYMSKDIVDAPQGATEYLDINLDRCVENDERYIVMSVNNYTHFNFSQLDIAKAGWMFRTGNMNGEAFEPSTVDNIFSILTDSNIVIPIVIDTQERTITWLDLDSQSLPQYVNNTNTNRVSLFKFIEASLMKNNVTLYDLFYHHALARGVIVDNKEDADLVIDMDGDITPSHIDLIASEYL